MIKLFICLHYGSFRFHLNVSNNNLQCIHVLALLIYLAEQSLGGYCIVDLLGWSADQSAISLCLVINQILSTNFKCTFTLLWHLNKGFVQIHFQVRISNSFWNTFKTSFRYSFWVIRCKVTSLLFKFPSKTFSANFIKSSVFSSSMYIIST